MAFKKLPRQIAGLVLAVCFAADVLAQAGYPAKPVKIIVPYSAGGPADIYARFIGRAPARSSAPTWWRNPPPTDTRFS